jgi:hypothetical protein
MEYELDFEIGLADMTLSDTSVRFGSSSSWKLFA